MDGLLSHLQDNVMMAQNGYITPHFVCSHHVVLESGKKTQNLINKYLKAPCFLEIFKIVIFQKSVWQPGVEVLKAEMLPFFGHCVCDRVEAVELPRPSSV